ncbi:nucleoside hydrolase [Peptostreptococcus russellii]|uniref:nucleoside hydrolase n=1 Tax=Peptostreptococcus russellii TaxID=215200 RepID=UPI003F58BEC9
MSKIPVIIDTDPGIDDFLAIMLAKSSAKLDIRAITAVCGNQTLEKTSKNALDIANLLDINVAVAKGAQTPLDRELYTAGDVHGENGIGNIYLEASSKEFDNRYAWDLIYDEAKKENGNLEIIAIGPLTNIAIAVLKYPELVNMVKRLTIMGGSASSGNRTEHAEFNIWADPLAADIVFKSGFNMVMVGLDVTRKTLLSEENIEEIKAVKSEHIDIIGSLLDEMFKRYKKLGNPGVVIHDALAVAYVIDESCLELKNCQVSIESRDEIRIGKTIVDLEGKDKNVAVAFEVDFNLFKDLFEKMPLYYN